MNLSGMAILIFAIIVCAGFLGWNIYEEYIKK